jgi:hypothetical protein
MLYVVLAEHSPEICPTSNATTRELMMKAAPEIPQLAKKFGVKIHAGPYVNHEHIAVLVAESDKAEALHNFLTDSGMAQWNRVRILPSQTMEDGMKEMDRVKPIF